MQSLLRDFRYAAAESVNLHVGDDIPLELRVDNQGAMHIVKNHVTSNRTKHIDVRYHFVRERVQDGTSKLVYVPTQQMLADILTKAVGAQVLYRLLPSIFGHRGIMRVREGVEIEHSHNSSGDEEEQAKADMPAIKRGCL